MFLSAYCSSVYCFGVVVCSVYVCVVCVAVFFVRGMSLSHSLYLYCDRHSSLSM